MANIAGVRVVESDAMPLDRCLLIGEQRIPMEFVAAMHSDPIEVGDELRITMRYKVAFSEDEIRGNVIAIKIGGV